LYYKTERLVLKTSLTFSDLKKYIKLKNIQINGVLEF